jgi:hypothetical protein
LLRDHRNAFVLPKLLAHSTLNDGFRSRPDPKLRQAIFDKYPTLTKSNRTLGR